MSFRLVNGLSRLLCGAIAVAVLGHTPQLQPDRVFASALQAPVNARPAQAPTPPAPTSTLPNSKDSVKFLVIGDSGTGDRAQYEVAARIVEAHKRFNFDFAIMLGDNLYGSESASAYESKFARPYKLLLDAGVKFYAALGNHDEPSQRFYKPFNMDGKRFYTH